MHREHEPNPPDPGLAFTAAQEVCKQVIAIASGLVAITVAFIKDLKEVSGGGLADLHDAWICAGISVFFALLTLMTLTGMLSDKHVKADGIYQTPAQQFAGLMLLAFLCTLGFTIAFGLNVS